MEQKANIFHGRFMKQGDKLVITGSDVKYKHFVKNLVEGQTVGIFMEANEDTGTLDQLAKVHVCIRELAKKTGQNYESLKLELKKNAGLCFVTQYDGEQVLYCKSLGDASKDELGLVIEAIKDAGEVVGINFN